jgi:hypothetical protein
MPHSTDFKVLIPKMIRLGETPHAIPGVTFVGHTCQLDFVLPASLVEDEYALLQCKSLHNQVSNKRLYLNTRWLKNILEPRSGRRRDWVFESTVVPPGWLEPGENSILIGYSNSNYESFILDDLVLWYKIR